MSTSNSTLEQAPEDIDPWGEGYFSDLSELSDEENEEEDSPKPPLPPPSLPLKKPFLPASKSNPSASKPTVVMEFIPRFKASRQTTESVETLFNRYERGEIDLDAEYQRDVIWSEAKQSNLIDSILNRAYIPPIVFSVQERNGQDIDICVDGKQRLTSIIAFMKGKISVKAPYGKVWFPASSNSKRKELDPKSVQRFRAFSIATVRYEDLVPEQERDIFNRVQMGIPLTPAERMAACNGPIADFVRDLQQLVVATFAAFGNTNVRWDKACGKDFCSVAQALYLIECDKKPTEPTYSKLEKWLSADKPISAHVKERAETTFKLLLYIASHETYKKSLRNMTPSMQLPVVLYLLYRRSRELPFTQLTQAARNLITTVTKQVKGKNKTANYRIDANVHKSMVKFTITDWSVQAAKLKVDPSDTVPALQVFEDSKGVYASSMVVEDVEMPEAPGASRKTRSTKNGTVEASVPALPSPAPTPVLAPFTSTTFQQPKMKRKLAVQVDNLEAPPSNKRKTLSGTLSSGPPMMPRSVTAPVPGSSRAKVVPVASSSKPSSATTKRAVAGYTPRPPPAGQDRREPSPVLLTGPSYSSRRAQSKIGRSASDHREVGALFIPPTPPASRASSAVSATEEVLVKKSPTIPKLPPPSVSSWIPLPRAEQSSPIPTGPRAMKNMFIPSRHFLPSNSRFPQSNQSVSQQPEGPSSLQAATNGNVSSPTPGSPMPPDISPYPAGSSSVNWSQRGASSSRETSDPRIRASNQSASSTPDCHGRPPPFTSRHS